ncbi:cell division protein FtsQ [Thermonema lapsum]|uniref:Cell division protein FtsQ n=1 Tax=Thermonema lapsum TaxID=28195 RepID=A0A846MQV0_9BACT|nr:hypothetical protein [Thermonema lapsum]NIK73740.1 cell division protein FtsQ [Thermonema lapsum]
MSKRRLKPWVQWLLTFLGMSLLIAAISKNYDEQSCQKVVVRFFPKIQDGTFLTEEDIRELLNRKGGIFLLGEKYKNLSLKQLEEQVKSNPYVEACNIYRDLAGNLFVEVHMVEPIARFYNPVGKDYYWSIEGKIIPFNSRYTPRVPVITREGEEQPPQAEKYENDAQLLALMQFIHTHPFWQACISQVHIDKKQDVWLYPQIGGQAIHVGNIKDISNIFAKLKILYDTILPIQGWYRYRKVDIRFERQIICE